jgi:hypothetical protein
MTPRGAKRAAKRHDLPGGYSSVTNGELPSGVLNR